MAWNNFICILTGASNLHYKKMVSLMICYFILTERVITKILEFDELTDETAL